MNKINNKNESENLVSVSFGQLVDFNIKYRFDLFFLPDLVDDYKDEDYLTQIEEGLENCRIDMKAFCTWYSDDIVIAEEVLQSSEFHTGYRTIEYIEEEKEDYFDIILFGQLDSAIKIYIPEELSRNRFYFYIGEVEVNFVDEITGRLMRKYLVDYQEYRHPLPFKRPPRPIRNGREFIPMDLFHVKEESFCTS